MFLVSLAGAVQQIVQHPGSIIDARFLVDGTFITGVGSIMHTLNRRAGRKADKERREEIAAIKEQQTITRLATERIEQMATGNDSDVRKLISDLALEVRTLTVMVKNGITDRMDDIRDRMGKMEERELSRAEHHNQRSA